MATNARTNDTLLWKILRFLHLNKFYRSVRDVLPTPVVDAVTNITLKNAHIPLVYAEELEPKYEMAWQRLQSLGVELGDYLEFGVSRGTSMACMHRVLSKLNLNKIRMIGFDSFQGMPESAKVEDEGMWEPGEFASSLENTTAFLNKAGVDWTRTHLVKGWFEDTLNAETTKRFKIKKASVIMVDCDIYSASKTALNYALPMIKDYAVIVFDDWRDDITFGEYKAYSEFLNENKFLLSEEFGSYFPTGRLFVVKNTKAVK